MDESGEIPSEETDESALSSVEKHYTWTDTKPSVAVVETVAEALRKRPFDLTPLYYAIDPATLDDAVSSSGTQNIRLTFDYAGLEVTVTDNGRVTVTPEESG